ncbi:hypothetical protein OJ996_20155 [Luteolibacter sp. GHJ8]|uniref:Uncharacterized protein n=1 Tax=Luteolibacter rhizosphaerae TaxID=2989719 RepID=A0ABT3G7T2_9BACT|nr:hypothetical protein [Luteolibacter rhizosphaerae]MCW1915912.1 hypothetical protein [Luteolibacter rhizosphaerae]
MTSAAGVESLPKYLLRSVTEIISALLAIASGCYGLLLTIYLFVMWMNLRLNFLPHATIALLGLIAIAGCFLALHLLLRNSSVARLGWFALVALLTEIFLRSPEFFGVKGLIH